MCICAHARVCLDSWVVSFCYCLGTGGGGGGEGAHTTTHTVTRVDIRVYKLPAR